MKALNRLAVPLLIVAALAGAPALAQQAAPAVLRVAFPIAEHGFDPQALYDEYSAKVANAIFDPLYTYDYLARPAKLVPNTAEALPVVSDDGRRYTIKVRRGIHFADHPAFGGKPRELTAHDYVYSIRRILDPAVRSYSLYILENRLAGLDPVLAQARKAGKLDYEAPIEGLKALDRYTLEIRFKDPNYSFVHWLTTISFAAVAHEVVKAKGDSAGRVMEDPVGTGPYRLAEWRRSQKIVLEANPKFRDLRWPEAAAGEAADAALAKGLAGRKLPLVPRVEISIIEEAQPRLLAFRNGELDYVEVPTSIAQTVLEGTKLKPEYEKLGARLLRQVDAALSFTFFNLESPVVGGYTPDRIALRRAIVMGNDRNARLRILMNGQGELATQVVPPPVPGHSAALAMKDPYDPAGARALLDRFGYRDRNGDGYREMPDGKPLLLVKGSTPTAADRAASELWKRNMDAIGLKVEFLVQKWPELNKMSEAGQLMIWNLAWISSIPDADPFYSPLYGPNIGLSNDARFNLPEFNKAYEAFRQLPEGPAREPLHRKMSELIAAYAPWILELYTFENVVASPRVRGMKLHPYIRDRWAYLDVAR
jgi:ABC-type transport system substrate-binding protein